MFRNDLFKDKRFLVTGGGTGLGRIMVEKFAELGADCVICGRRDGILEETARQIMDKFPGRRIDTPQPWRRWSNASGPPGRSTAW